MCIKEKKDLVFGLLAAVIAFLVYANTLGNGFTTDDHGTILNNLVLKGSPLSLFGVIDTNSTTQLLPFYRPFTYLTFFIEGRLYGFNPFLMHLVNILLHAVNAFLVYQLSRSLFDDHRPALLVSLLFAVHPIHSESVNYLSGGRNTMLACLFVLMAYLTHQRSIARSSTSGAIVGALFFLGGLFSKEFAMMVLPFILAQELMSRNKQESEERFKVVGRLAPYAIAVICYLVLRWLTLSELGIQAGFVPGFGAQKFTELYDIPSLAERVLNNAYIIPKYLLTIVWPTALSPRYIIPDDFHAIAPQLIAVWVCIIAIIGWLLKQDNNRVIIFGLAWIVAFWIPVSGIVYFSIIEMAERYFYLPAIGLWIIAADQSMRLIRHQKKVIRYVTIAAAIFLGVMAALTIKRNLDWKNDITLFTRMVQQYPENPFGFNHLGAAYLERKGPNDLQLAERNLEKALALNPTTQFVQPQLGYIRLERGDLSGALFYLSEALRRDTVDREARINRGITYERMGRYEEALADYSYYLTIPSYNDLPGSQEYAEDKVREISRH